MAAQAPLHSSHEREAFFASLEAFQHPCHGFFNLPVNTDSPVIPGDAKRRRAAGLRGTGAPHFIVHQIDIKYTCA